MEGKMTTGQEKTTQALKYAIQMEIDGKEFYLKASRESGNELGKKLLESLGYNRKIITVKNSNKSMKLSVNHISGRWWILSRMAARS